MAVVKATIASALLAHYQACEDDELTNAQIADAMADIIRNAILSASISVPGTGLIAPYGGGAVTGTSTSGSVS